MYTCIHTCTLNTEETLELEECGQSLQNAALFEVHGICMSLVSTNTLFLLSLIDRIQSDLGD